MSAVRVSSSQSPRKDAGSSASALSIAASLTRTTRSPAVRSKAAPRRAARGGAGRPGGAQQLGVGGLERHQLRVGLPGGLEEQPVVADEGLVAVPRDRPADRAHRPLGAGAVPPLAWAA